MSKLLDDVKALAEVGPPTSCEYTYDEQGHTPVMACCGASILGPHLGNCPWFSLPHLVALVEAAERLREPIAYTESELFEGVPAERFRVVDMAAYDAIVAALDGRLAQTTADRLAGGE